MDVTLIYGKQGSFMVSLHTSKGTNSINMKYFLMDSHIIHGCHAVICIQSVYFLPY